MITHEEAQGLIKKNSPLPREEELILSAVVALGRVTAEDIRSPLALPSFDNSAMDGFALRSGDTRVATKEKLVFLQVAGTIKAGDGPRNILKNGEAYRIMTGAPIVKGADAVLPLEQAVLKKGLLAIDRAVEKGRNVRFRGEEIEKGELVLQKGSILNPGTIGFLSAMGISKIKVYKTPRVVLVATGSELVAPGRALTDGKIYDSNSPMILAALEDMRIRPVFLKRLADQPGAIRKWVDFALKESDFLILMGGVSAGDYDFVKDILNAAGVETVFWKVRQKPGRPLYFGKRKETLVFGLPGNPASVFTCFYEYVYPAIRMFMGYKNPYLRSDRMKLEESVRTDPDKLLFLKGKKNGAAHTVAPLKRQKSHMLSSLCKADSFIVVPRSLTTLEAGEAAAVHSLPYALECRP